MNQIRQCVRDQLARGKAFLKSSGTTSYALDAALLLMEATGLTKAGLYMNGDALLTNGQIERYDGLLRQRASHMPVQYILNRCEFMSLDFYVDENVLIPRPDTEILAERAIRLIREHGFSRVLELGAGSGCVSVSIAHYCRDVRVTAVDVCAEALAVAKKNAAENGVIGRVAFVLGDLFQNVEKSGEGFHLIVSNPPYIPDADMEALPDSVRRFEPALALAGGEDGLRFYRAVASGCGPYLRPEGALILEIGRGQADSVARILQSDGFHHISVYKDLAGLDRVAEAWREPEDRRVFSGSN